MSVFDFCTDCAGLPYVVLGSGGIAPPEKAVEAFPDNFEGCGLGERLFTEDFTATVAGLGVYERLGSGGTAEEL